MNAVFSSSATKPPQLSPMRFKIGRLQRCSGNPINLTHTVSHLSLPTRHPTSFPHSLRYIGKPPTLPVPSLRILRASFGLSKTNNHKPLLSSSTFRLPFTFQVCQTLFFINLKSGIGEVPPPHHPTKHDSNCPNLSAVSFFPTLTLTISPVNSNPFPTTTLAKDLGLSIITWAFLSSPSLVFCCSNLLVPTPRERSFSAMIFQPLTKPFPSGIHMPKLFLPKSRTEHNKKSLALFERLSNL